MKNIKHIAAVLVLLLLVGCGKENSSNDLKVALPPPIEQSLSVSLSKTQIAANGTEETVITVKDQTGSDVTAASVIYAGSVVLTKNTFSTSVAGSYLIRATKGTISSPGVNLLAVNQGSFVFTQKVLAEFFTGTWCGICPGTLIPMENYTQSNPNTIMVGVHGPSGSNDPFQYIFDTQLRNKFNVSGVPAVLLNRNNFWDGKTATLDQLASKKSILGIALESEISGASVQLKVNVKFAENIATPLKLVVQLVEDGIPYDQSNYGHFGLPNPISGFVHRNVLRSSATDVFGDAIPVSEQTKGSTYEKSFSINPSSYTLSRCRIVAFVVYSDNSSGLKGALNAQTVQVGKSIQFD